MLKKTKQLHGSKRSWVSEICSVKARDLIGPFLPSAFRKLNNGIKCRVDMNSTCGDGGSKKEIGSYYCNIFNVFIQHLFIHSFKKISHPFLLGIQDNMQTAKSNHIRTGNYKTEQK